VSERVRPLRPETTRDAERTHLVADLGGSKIAVARVDAAGLVHQRRETPTPRPGTEDAVVGALLAALEPVRRPDDRRVGVAATGRVLAGRVQAVNPGTLTGWDDVDLVGRIRAASGLDAVLLNDAHAAAYGEWRFGAGRGSDAAFAFVTVSTGIGAGIVVRGEPWIGAHGLAAHLGFLPDRSRGGYLEAHASGRALERRATARAGVPTEPRQALRRAAAGDAAMGELLDELADDLAVALLQLHWIVDPEAIAIGGGLGLAGGMLARLEARVRARTAGQPGVPPRLLRARLGVDAGLIGMAAWMDRHDRT
jgi:N-acylmannosamine kinase